MADASAAALPPISAELVGLTGEPVESSWTHDDTMLYALAVGAGQDDPTRELAFTTENSDGVRPAVLPTYANIITRGARVPFDVDMTRLVHAEQAFTVAAALPTAGTARVTAEITAVWDKGSGAIVTTEARAVDVRTGDPLATATQSVFVRGAGGFGGERGPSPSWTRPDRPADHVATYRIRTEQALLYRLTGDRNPLHSDPAFAARAGFDRPILHGMCTYGYAGRALLEHACDGDPARWGSMSARFTRPVWPGDELVVQVWRDDKGASFVATRGADVVLDQGRLTLA